MSVADYAAKFEELSCFCPHINVVSLKVVCVLRLSSLLDFMRLECFQRWSTSLEFMTRITRQEQATTKVKMTRGARVGIMVSHMEVQVITERRR